MAVAILTPANCTQALADLLINFPGISGGAGQVHQRRRIVRSEADVKAVLAGDGGKVNAWMISSAAANTSVTQRNPGFKGIGQKGGADGNVVTTFQFSIEAYYQVDDANASETVFRDLAWGVASDINAYGTLPIVGVIMQLPADIEQFGFIVLAGFGFYHYARIGVGFTGRTH